MSGILFLHGGGHSNHTRYTKLEEKFNQEGIVTHTFDHHASSLADRLIEAEQELTKFKQESGLGDSDILLWGSSMGGHVACRLAAKHPQLKGIILQSAAAYSAAAETIPFGPAFTAELTRPNSWADSPAFSAVEAYFGPVLVMYGEHDDVIPEGVISHYRARAEQCGSFRILEGGGHSMLRPSTPAQHSAWEQMFAHALDFSTSLPPIL